MANSTIEDLVEETTPISTDILPIVDDPAVTPITKKVTVSNLLAVYDTQTATLTNKTLTGCTGLPPAGVVGTAATLGANTFTGAQTFSDHITLAAGKKLYLDGSTNSYITEASNGVVRLYSDQIEQFSARAIQGVAFGSGVDVSLKLGTKLFFNNYVGTSWLVEEAANTLSLYTSSQKRVDFVDSGIDLLGNNIDNVQNIIHDQTDYTSVTGATTVNFGHDQLQTYALTGNITISTSGSASGKNKTMKIKPDGTDRTVTVPATWKWVGTNPTTSNVITITASKTAILTLTAFGGGDANIVAAYAVEE